jgi:glycosyltransferase involved in cell wall biosynthesis
MFSAIWEENGRKEKGRVSRLAVIVPCYNEEEVLKTTSKVLRELIEDLVRKEKAEKGSFVLFVDDGSKDSTWNLIEEEHRLHSAVYGLKLAGNVGHQNALLAGLMTAKDMADVAVSIDADLQDDVQVIEKMIDEYHSGFDIVYGVRNSRKSDSFFKRTTAVGFYKMMKFLGVKTVFNHADFRLMSKRALEQLNRFKERNLFLRGIVPLIGYRTTSVYYERKERFAGESKYPLKKMLSLAFEGVTSFSVKPIVMITVIGGIIVFCSILAAVYALISYFSGHVVQGWTSLILSIWFIGGVQLLSIGMIGQYIGKIYLEVKERPRYNIEILLK